MQARTDATGQEVDILKMEQEPPPEGITDDGPRTMLAAYKAKQSNLNNLGVTKLALVAIATHRAGIEGNLADEALELLMEMTNAGNSLTCNNV